MTAKIETIRNADGTILRLIGHLEADHLPLLNGLIEADAGRIILEMSEVTLVDVEMIRFLIGCEAQGIELRECSAYIREWITRERESEG